LGPDPFHDRAVLERSLNNLAQRSLITEAVAAEILNHPYHEIEGAIWDVLLPVSIGLANLLQEEFEKLLDASVNGYPGVFSPPPTSQVLFEVDPTEVRRFPGPNGRLLRVTPIPRLQTVTVQTGYRREVGGQGNPAAPVTVAFADQNNQEWFPGAVFLGEGVFITLDDDGWHPPMTGGAADAWSDAFRNVRGYDPVGRMLTRDSRAELHPVFVWWHTLSHLLLRALSIDAGYSSASIRERIYLQVDPQTGRARGGIILYATQPGSEGSLGGMIALAPSFDAVLTRAFQMVQACSNDPLCLEQSFGPGNSNGAACYGCLLTSETSCEHRNLWLDRAVLMQMLP
jgi:hypothetical protein